MSSATRTCREGATAANGTLHAGWRRSRASGALPLFLSSGREASSTRYPPLPLLSFNNHTCSCRPVVWARVSKYSPIQVVTISPRSLRCRDERPPRVGVCPSHPPLRGKGDIGRCKAAGSKKPEAYSLEYVEDVFEPRTTQMPADRLPQQMA
jgi:hypothetical protein